MTCKSLVALLSIVATALFLPAPASGQDGGTAPPSWPQFLGPDRTGISAEKGLMKSWPEGGPREVWRAEGGVGQSGLAISGGKLITLVQRDGKQWAVAHDALKGDPLWQSPLGAAYSNTQGNGPRATPTIVGGTVYTFTGNGTLSALNLADGRALWEHNTVEQLGGKVADYGMACSPLVVGDLVVVTVGASGGAVAAYHRSTGELAWKSGSDRAGYSSPALLDVAGGKQLVVFTGEAAVGLNPTSGDELWRHPYVTDFDCNIATPLSVDGGVFISAGENHGCALLDIKRSGAGYEVGERWTSQGGGSVMRNEWQTSMLIDGKLYGFNNVGSAGPVTHLACIDAKTGEQQWQKLRFGKGNLIAADGKLFMTTLRGEVVVVRADPEKFEELGRKRVIGDTRQAPALAGGLLYVRDNREIVCLDVRE